MSFWRPCSELGATTPSKNGIHQNDTQHNLIISFFAEGHYAEHSINNIMTNVIMQCVVILSEVTPSVVILSEAAPSVVILSEATPSVALLSEDRLNVVMLNVALLADCGYSECCLAG